MSIENAVEFLLFSYFGLNFDDKDKPERIIDFAIKKAYKDATMQGAYNALKKNINKDSSDGTSILKKEINLLVQEDYLMDYDSWHSDDENGVCKKLVDVYDKVKCPDSNNENAFSYGNAQKWINMTIKYLHMLLELFGKYYPECNFCQKYKKLNDLYSYFHAPVDSYIIESIWEDEEIRLPLIEDNLLKEGKRGKYCSEKVLAWSKWDKNEYDNFKNDLHKKVGCPIEWEHNAWIKTVKKRKEKERV